MKKVEPPAPVMTPGKNVLRMFFCFWRGNDNLPLVLPLSFCVEIPSNPATTSNLLPWPTPSDLNTRLRRIVAGFQRILKREELKRVAVEKVSLLTRFREVEQSLI